MGLSSEAAAWHAFQRSNVHLPLAAQGPNCVKSPEPFRLVLQSLRHVPFPGHLYQALTAPAISVSLRVSFFDENNKAFFGKTFCGQRHRAVPDPTRAEVNLEVDDAVYFVTSVRDDSCFAVLEVVAHVEMDGNSVNTAGLAWAVLPLFAPEPAREVTVRLCSGSPRALLMMPAGQARSIIPTAHIAAELNYTLEPHPALQPCVHLFPNNSMVGFGSLVPGLVPPGLDQRRRSYDRPQLQPVCSYSLDMLSVELEPSVNDFEQHFLRHVIRQWRAEHLSSEAGESSSRAASPLPEAEGDDPLLADTSITERRVRISVHNGLHFLGAPALAYLKPDPAESNLLMFEGVLDLRDVPVDSRCAIVLQLEYQVSLPFSTEAPAGMSKKALQRMRSSSQVMPSHVTKLYVVRWVPLLPFPDGEQRPLQEIPLLSMIGSPTVSPSNSLVFTSAFLRPDVPLTEAKQMPVKLQFRLAEEPNVPAADVGVLPRTASMRLPPMMRSRLQSQRSHTASVSGLRSGADSPVSARRQPGRLASQRGKRPVSLGVLPESTGASSSDLRQSASYRKPQPSRLGRSDESGPIVTDADLQERPVPVAAGAVALLPTAAASSPVLSVTSGGAVSHNMLADALAAPHLPRATLAALEQARFPAIVSGEVVGAHGYQVAEPVPGPGTLCQQEWDDVLTVNELCFQVLGMTPQLEPAMKQPDGSSVPNAPYRPIAPPRHLFLSFKFYRFESYQSPRLRLVAPSTAITSEGYDEDRHAAAPQDPRVPYIVHQADNDQPGLSVRFTVDPADMRPDERERLIHYLASKMLQVDLWDGDSLMLVGSAFVPLQRLLRGGNPYVQSVLELEVQRGDVLNPGASHPAGQSSQQAVEMHAAQAPVVRQRGSLLLRVANIGRLSRVRAPQPVAAPIVNPQKPVVHTVKAQRLKDSDALLVATTAGSGQDHEAQRKVQRLKAIQQAKAKGNASLPARLHSSASAPEFPSAEHARTRTKRDRIVSLLAQSARTTYTIHPSFASSVFFEYIFTNPLDHDAVFLINFKDPELSLITDKNEWLYFARKYHTESSVEDNLVLRQGRVFSVFVRRQEAVALPFRFQSFLAGSVSAKVPRKARAATTCDAQPDGEQAAVTVVARRGAAHTHPLDRQTQLDPGIVPRTIVVNFVEQQEDRLCATLEVLVRPHSFVADQVFRFYSSQLQFFKKTIRLPVAAARDVYIQCSSDKVVVDTTLPAQPHEPLDVRLKYPCGPSPEVTSFCLALYDHALQSDPSQVWQVFVHALEQTSVAASLGQTVRASLLLRSKLSSRSVQCFSSDPQLQVTPREPFMLIAGATHDIALSFRPEVVGEKSFQVNVVDTESFMLVATWLVTTQTSPPTITKAFEIVLPVGHGANKRVAYRNPYASTKTFRLSTSRPDLVSFKETLLEIPPHELRYLGLRFHACQVAGAAEVLIFLNDANDRNEECFSVNLVFRDSSSDA
eukprot:m.164404 g.164404  ORF g.164404 m.164404 type:complete len:1465 (-) comp21057_c0_seq3:83-4477(-)